ncbi:MAG: hypothetical protein ACP5HG_13850 [Anaerolineae bacterium]
MGADLTRIVGAVAAFAVIFLSGYRLSRAGTPYSTLLLTVHKLMGVAAAVALVVTMVRANRAAMLGTGKLVRCARRTGGSSKPPYPTTPDSDPRSADR